MHSNDLEACEKKCCYFWFHSEVKFVTRFGCFFTYSFCVEVLKGELNSTSTYVLAQLTKDQLLVHHINTPTKINVKIYKCELSTLYWLPKLHKRPYKSRFISNLSHCSTTILSKHNYYICSYSCQDHVMKYSETAFSNSNVNYFWSIKNSSEVIEKLRLRNFQGSQVRVNEVWTKYPEHWQSDFNAEKSCHKELMFNSNFG